MKKSHAIFYGKPITKVEAHLSSQYADYSLSCEYAGDRYHIWLDRRTKSMFDPKRNATLFKNSMAEYGEPGYYRTRHLRVDSKLASGLIAAMMAEAEEKNLFAVADEKLRQELAEESRKNNEAVRLGKIKEAGQEMLRVLEAIADYWEDSDAHPLNPGAYLTDEDVPIRELILRITVKLAPAEKVSA